MQESDFAAIGRATVKLGMTSVLLMWLAGSLWVLSDLWQTWRRGELDDVAAWVICAFVGTVAISIGGSAIYGLYRIWLTKERPLDG